MSLSIRLVFLTLLVTAQSVFAQELPTIDVVYQSPEGSIFDRNCSRTTKTEPNREWIQEVVRRRAEFQALWDKDGPRYLSAVLNEVGLPFPYRAMQATLTVCPAVGSMSDPLFITVREFLSDASNSPPASMFAVYLFHELMHHYVRAVPSSSRLLKKYGSEPPVVQNHLHVVALVRFALMTLGKDSELKYAEAQAGQPNRAVEIVNVEGYKPFLDELRALSKRGLTAN